MNNKILKQTDEYYSKKLHEFGTTSKGVDWNSEKSQIIRFHQLSKIIEEKEEFSICDYGCGYGFYYEYLEKYYNKYRYYGIDISQDMIVAANEKYGKKNIQFFCGSEIKKSYDYIIASGIFNVRQQIKDEEWKGYILESLNQFNKNAKKGFAFNVLTKYSDAEYMKDYLYYADPLFFFDYAKKYFSKNVALLHDYQLYEFTLLIRK